MIEGSGRAGHGWCPGAGRIRPERELILVLLTQGMVSEWEQPSIRKQIAELDK